jgi:periplasmic protein TonB
VPSRNPRKLPRTYPVAFETWTQKTSDVLRVKRLLLGAGVGMSIVVGGVAFMVLTSSQAAAETEEEEAKVVEVQLAKEPEPEPEPEPPPPAPPELKPHHSNPGPRLQKIETPTTISEEKVQEKEAKPSSGGGDPYEKGGGDGTTGEKTVVEAPVAPPPPPPPVLPKVKKPVPVSEGMTPPVAIVKLVKPEYPADAKAAGIEGTVVVRYVVNEQGEVTEARAIKGPPEMFAVCVASVKSQHFSPALDADGKPVMVVRYLKFPFKLRT